MRIAFILSAVLTLALAGCSGNSQSSSESSPTPAESTNAMGAMATAAANAGHAMAGAAGTAAKTAAGAAGAAGAMAKSAAGAAGAAASNMVPHSVSYALKAQNGSGENGKVTLVSTGHATTVTISLTGENTTGSQPAHIHVGPCSNLGAVKYPLSDVVLGKEVTIVNVPLATLMNGTFAVNVHESSKQLNKYVSCADLTKANML